VRAAPRVERTVPVFHDHSREELRRAYLEAWRKHRAGQPLEPLEAQLAHLIEEHPEYHALFEASGAAVAAEFLPEGGAENPFLHLGLHLAIREQVATDRPAGIARIHAALARRFGSAHQAEHRMLEVLGETLWSAQRVGRAPDEGEYLERLRSLEA
jgi:Domain of unknown function (DUF1841)